jgi:prepilin-type N-terminal cleavage/methylation domain-containing protein/prepilin-type processing-associated H-X9-DG protein
MTTRLANIEFHKRVRGFTLVELLVVIAIIALLLSILMPSLKRARDQAKRIVCASNIKQTGLAVELYTSSNRDFYPYDYLPIAADKRNMDGTKTTWQQLLIPYGQNNGKVFTCSNYVQSWNTVVKAANRGLTLTDKLNWYDWFTPSGVASFGYNHRSLGCEGWNSGWGCYSNNGSITLRVKTVGLYHPQQLIVFLDNGGFLALENMWPDSYPPPQWYRNGPGELAPKQWRHNNGLNIFFADFHYEWASIKAKYFDYYPQKQNPYWDNVQ